MSTTDQVVWPKNNLYSPLFVQVKKTQLSSVVVLGKLCSDKCSCNLSLESVLRTHLACPILEPPDDRTSQALT